ncbi:MAG: magnesium transporter, partial [Candidatus Eisenbacteria bacterium]|nr:magnesium transporter [Candidatus Eisenbacteria bacterium]
LGRLFAEHDLQAVPVVDEEGRMQGIVTVDDIVDVIQEEATEDIQKIGGTEALDAPYLEVGYRSMLSKRVVWLMVLFVGELLTATAMGRFEDEIAKAVVLSVFIPLIISIGGNSGSQASTLVIRAMALGEVTLADWWRVMHRELIQGATIGSILGVIGMGRVYLWESLFHAYGEHTMRLGITVAGSVAGVVLFGTLSGSMLPFILKRAGLDPASASAPFVATLVDVTGIVIYFSIASLMLRGTLL